MSRGGGRLLRRLVLFWGGDWGDDVVGWWVLWMWRVLGHGY